MSTAIYQALKNQNKTVIELAQDLGVSRSAVYQSIDGGGSRVIRIELALLAERKPTELWGRMHAYELDDALYFKKLGVL